MVFFWCSFLAVFYSCPLLGSNCGHCLSVDNKFNCVYCKNTDSCILSPDCPGTVLQGIDDVGQCADHMIDSVSLIDSLIDCFVQKAYSHFFVIFFIKKLCENSDASIILCVLDHYSTHNNYEYFVSLSSSTQWLVHFKETRLLLLKD